MGIIQVHNLLSFIYLKQVKIFKILKDEYFSQITDMSIFLQEERKQVEEDLKKREEELTPLYHQVAVMFADLHDTPWRMQDKGCIHVRVVDIAWLIVIFSTL